MKLFKMVCFSILLVLPIVCLGNTNKHISLDTVRITTFHDTIFSTKLPSIEFRAGTYHNFGEATTVGYKLILRGEELDIRGAQLYKEDPESNTDNPLHLLSPFHIHVGDSSDNRRIDHIYVIHKFPMSEFFSTDDSLVVITNKGNFTLYLSEEKRSTVKYAPIIESLNEELSEKQNDLNNSKQTIAIIIVICLILGAIGFIYYRKKQSFKSEQINHLFMLISENEMNNRRLKAKLSDLMRNRFSTINQLCYEYFEKADTNFLKKSIYTKVEQEIEKLKSQNQLSQFENILNEYCDDIILRIKAQIPQLSDVELTLLIYLYSGLSARTICVLMDIQLKTFYMRRLRLKNKIEISDAPDKKWFISYM